MAPIPSGELTLSEIPFSAITPREKGEPRSRFVTAGVFAQITSRELLYQP